MVSVYGVVFRKKYSKIALNFFFDQTYFILKVAHTIIIFQNSIS